MHLAIIDVVVVLAFVAAGGVLLLPHVANSKLWNATITPLASIIGSGFLVSAPLLATIAGRYAVFVMAILCVAAYFIGSAVRHNIGVLEEKLEDKQAGAVIVWLGVAADIALVVAYVISICFYIKLLAAFALKPIGMSEGFPSDMLATAITFVLGALGLLRGFGSLENLEHYAVVFKLAVIAALLGGLAVFNGYAFADGSIMLPAAPHDFGWHSVRVALGALLVIQGFETSRYIGQHYDRETRVFSMRFAQLLAGAIYIAFILLVTPILSKIHDTSETAIIDYAAVVTPILAVMLTFGAIAAQLSAATADFVGSAGLAAVHVHLSNRRYLYPIIAAVVIAATWLTDIFEILTLASQAFAAYYAVQCVLALMTTERKRAGRIIVFSIGLIISLAALFFGVSAH